MADRYQSYEAFWPFYVSQHLHPTTRRLHFVGLTLAFAALVAGALVGWGWLLVVPVAGYGFAWIAHFFVEENKPATFTYPLWSLRGDLRMYRLMLRGRMGPEIARARDLLARAEQQLHPRGAVE